MRIENLCIALQLISNRMCGRIHLLYLLPCRPQPNSYHMVLIRAIRREKTCTRLFFGS